MTKQFTQTEATNINGKDYWGQASNRDGLLVESSIEQYTIDNGNATVIAPPLRIFPAKEYNSTNLIQQEILFTKSEGDDNDNANGTWRSRYFALIGARLYRNGVPFDNETEGYLDEVYAGQNVAPYHQGLDADKFSASTSLHSLASLLEALVPAVQNEPARQMATIEINRDQYGGVQEHGAEAPEHRIDHITRRHQFGMAEVDKAKTPEQMAKVRDDAVALFNDTDMYHGGGVIHDAILTIECVGMMIADPNQTDARNIPFQMDRLSGMINNSLPAELPARRGVRDGLRGRQRTNFVLMHQACVSVLNSRRVEVPKTDGTCVEVHLPISSSEIPSIASEALVKYKELLDADTSGDSRDGLLIDLLPVFDAKDLIDYEPEVL